MAEANPLLSTARASDSSPQIQLHPLVLLTISDYITRHTLRKQEGPVVGAILGQQDGRTITMEVAFECLVKANDNGDAVLDNEWFNDRLEQFKDVHKSPPLDLVAWFTLAPPSGPQPTHLPIHRYLQTLYNESALLLLFHPSAVLEGTATGGKLPLTIYESVMEPRSGTETSSMEVDAPGGEGKELRFRELPYSIETGEAEMIGVDFVAKGGGNATAVDSTKTQGGGAAGKTSTGKGKARAGDAQVNGAVESESLELSPEDEELLSSLTAKQNAIRMLHRRISLLRAYLSSLPPSYLTDASLPFSTPQDSNSTTAAAPLDHTILRSLRALTARLPLLTPATPTAASAFQSETLEQRSDVQLISLLSSITSSLESAKELGRKSQVIESAKATKRAGRGGGGFGGFGGGGGSFMETVMGGGGGGGMGVGEFREFGGGEGGLGRRF
ncbi:hypothetical protein H2201_002866 [Coniosporium apollinis]|uniref:COP9 signalosome complex subunit 6 n=1 Tax=Coniosporium apollinis TaxID=61459 RepID=A0ABQ9NY42_9PEZI|nr:hypothetical protein H2201_002866 [Coniosporium apollinis]